MTRIPEQRVSAVNRTVGFSVNARDAR